MTKMRYQSGKPVSILIADDDPIVRKAVRSVLELTPGLKVTGEADDGKTAVELVSRLAPDILLLDLLMPHLPGLETLRAITSANIETRALLLCSTITNRQVLEALQLGARGVLLKSNLEELVRAIEAVMSGAYWIQGKSVLNVMQIVEELTASTRLEKRPANRFQLTSRELEIVSLITQGYTNKDIAQSLSIAEETVKRHLTNIFNKVGMSNRLELALFAIENGLAGK